MENTGIVFCLVISFLISKKQLKYTLKTKVEKIKNDFDRLHGNFREKRRKKREK